MARNTEHATEVFKLRLRPTILRALEAEAEDEERNVSSLIRKILRDHVEHGGTTRTRQAIEPQSIRAELEGAVQPEQYQP